jgi:hypothetical protein
LIVTGAPKIGRIRDLIPLPLSSSVSALLAAEVASISTTLTISPISWARTSATATC